MRGYERQVADYLNDTRAFVFDMHDTLVDGKTGYIAHNMELAKKFDVPKTREEVIELYGIGDFKEMLRQLCGTDDLDAIMAVHALGKHRAEFQLQPISTVPNDLRTLRRLGYVVGIFTATTSAMLMRDLEIAHYDIDELFDFTDTVYSTSVKKSDPKSFATTIAHLAQYGIAPEQTLYVGDGRGDMQGSLGAGLKFIGIEQGFVTREEFADNGVLSMPNVHGLVNVVRRKHGQL